MIGRNIGRTCSSSHFSRGSPGPRAVGMRVKLKHYPTVTRLCIN